MARIALEHEIFTERGITPEVAEARGYRRYETPEDVYAVDSRWQAFPGHLKQWCVGSPGWVMPKFRVPGSYWGDPLAQLRPDKPLRDRTYGHDHDGMTHVAQDCACGVRKHSARVLARQPQEPLGSYEREQHEAGKNHLDERGRPVRDPDTKEPIPTEGPHRHVTFKKYLLPPGPHGKRLDCHPTTDFYASHERFFFAFEGTLKNDSFVSLGEAALNTPSVNTWWQNMLAGLDRFFLPVQLSDEDLRSMPPWDVLLELDPWEGIPELEALVAECLRGVPIIVVCDSDWHHNPEVASQALICCDRLIELGCPAKVAAPPEGPVLYVAHNGRTIRKKVGADDFFGRDNGHPDGEPDDLRIVDPQPGPGFNSFARDYRRRERGKGRKSDSVELDLELLRWLIVHSAATGAVKRPVTTVARYMDLSDDWVFDATNRLWESGAIEIDALAPLVEDRFIRVPNRRRALALGRGHKGKTPTILLREDLKPPEREPLTVGEWLGSL
jgi:hypothetical protein